MANMSCSRGAFSQREKAATAGRTDDGHRPPGYVDEPEGRAAHDRLLESFAPLAPHDDQIRTDPIGLAAERVRDLRVRLGVDVFESDAAGVCAEPPPSGIEDAPRIQTAVAHGHDDQLAARLAAREPGREPHRRRSRS